MEEKICVKCKEIKSMSEFSYQHGKNRKPRHYSWCRQCSSIAASKRNKKKREEDPKKVRAIDRKMYHKNRDKISKRAKERSRKLKGKCIEYMGGECYVCSYKGYLGAMDFHHIDSSEKDFMITSTTNWEKIKKELSKCVLLCSNCHRGIHSGELKVDFKGNHIQLDAV